MTVGPSPYQEEDDPEHDLGPWIESTSSTRVSRYRYDFAKGREALQVQWRNNSNHGYIYTGIDYDIYRNFSRAVSKGRRVNDILNKYPYRLMEVDEVEAPQNPKRDAVSSRVVH